MSLTCSGETMTASCLKCCGNTLEVSLMDGRNVIAPLSAFPGLSGATPAQRDNWMLIDDGRVLGWPELGKKIPLKEVLDATRQAWSAE